MREMAGLPLMSGKMLESCVAISLTMAAKSSGAVVSSVLLQCAMRLCGCIGLSGGGVSGGVSGCDGDASAVSG